MIFIIFSSLGLDSGPADQVNYIGVIGLGLEVAKVKPFQQLVCCAEAPVGSSALLSVTFRESPELAGLSFGSMCVGPNGWSPHGQGNWSAGVMRLTLRG